MTHKHDVGTLVGSQHRTVTQMREIRKEVKDRIENGKKAASVAVWKAKAKAMTQARAKARAKAKGKALLVPQALIPIAGSCEVPT